MENAFYDMNAAKRQNRKVVRAGKVSGTVEK
jgi:hypothetical protein